EKYILDNQVMTQAEMDKLNEKIDALVEEAVDFALASKFPEVSSAVEDVYTDIVEEGRSR
ncbi:MAG: pyruvate dehydrogenase (acetyl-transferring) E1 component subunit alpha, partial [Firmicutes bacterium HGW-Firmicutes-6]